MNMPALRKKADTTANANIAAKTRKKVDKKTPTKVAAGKSKNPTPARTSKSSKVKVANKLLASLSAAEYRRLLPHLEPIGLMFGDVLFEPGSAINYVYFPNDSLVSMLTVVDDRLALEVGMVGCEGMVGVAFSLGITTSPVRAVVQGAGTAMRMKAALFRKALNANGTLQKSVNLYIHAFMAQVAQTAACNRFHVVEARLARWLLMTRDRVDADHFELTHEFLGRMLGVRRVGVTKAANALKQQNLIEYSRGNIVILNGRGLEAASCSCYKTLRDAQPF